MDVTKRHSINDVFDDFRGRRSGLIKALTEEKNKLFEACDPDKEDLCLYGHPNGTWEVAVPCEMVPPQLPEPVLGINFPRDQSWLSTLAAHSDSWLLSVAFYYGTRFGFDKSARMELFQKINSLPTLVEIVSGKGYKMPKAQSVNRNCNRRRSSEKTVIIDLPRQSQQIKLEKTHTLSKENEEEEEDEIEEDQHDKTLNAYCNIKRRQSSEKTSQQLNLEKTHIIWKEKEEDEHDMAVIDPYGHCNRNRRQSSEKTLPRQSRQLQLERISAASKEEEESEKEREVGEEEDTLCGFCGEQDGDEFWIICDWCETWFHGNCVNMTPEKAGHIKKYKCPSC